MHGSYRIINIIFLFLIRVLLICTNANTNNKEQQIYVTTTVGTVIGLREDSVIAFKGVPYAEPPVGYLRFKPPKPKRPLTYPLETFNFSAECLQSNKFSDSNGVKKDEDCLYLNIWLPAERPSDSFKKMYPVMVWIYGGAFMHGGTSKILYSGDRLAAKGTIIVTLNYRLGALGFLVSTADGLFGNYGLADQKLALQWIKSNIQYFNGDADRITVFGESAGAMSIGLHHLDQQLNRNLALGPTSSLFRAIILQSNPLGYKYRGATVANFIGHSFKQLLDCEDLVCLLSESVDELMHAQDILMATPRSIGDFFTWGPVLTDITWHRELRLRPSTAVANITVTQPIDAIKSITRSGVPVIIGTNEHEGHVFVYSAFPFRLPKLMYQFLILSFFRQAAPSVLRTYAQLAKKSSADYRVVMSAIINDYLFRCPNQLYAHLLSSAGSPVFLYEFSLATRIPGLPCCDGLTCHTAEIPYVFCRSEIIQEDYSWPWEKQSSMSSIMNTTMFQSLLNSTDVESTLTKRQATDERVSRNMADFWVNFARYGDPNGEPSANGYKGGTRPSGTPWWPRLLGEIASSEAARDIETFYKREGPLVRENIKKANGLDGTKLIEESSRYGIDRSSPISRMKGSRFVHMLNFGDVPEMDIVEQDCVCDFWNKLHYHF